MARASVAAQRRRARSSSTDSRLVYFVLMVWTVTFLMQTILPIEGENWISYSGETPQGFRRWLCRNYFSQHEVGFSLQRVVHIEDQVDLPRTPLLDHHRMLQEVPPHRGEVHRLVTPW